MNWTTPSRIGKLFWGSAPDGSMIDEVASPAIRDQGALPRAERRELVQCARSTQQDSPLVAVEDEPVEDEAQRRERRERVPRNMWPTQLQLSVPHPTIIVSSLLAQQRLHAQRRGAGRAAVARGPRPAHRRVGQQHDLHQDGQGRRRQGRRLRGLAQHSVLRARRRARGQLRRGLLGGGRGCVALRPASQVFDADSRAFAAQKILP